MTEHGTHVLVIDDDPGILRLVRFLLERHGCQVATASTYDEASEIVRHDRPQVVLLDWQLGEVDGITLIGPLRAAIPHAPVLMLTAHVDTDLIVASMRAGAYDFLSKPVEEPRLVAAVMKAAEHHRLLQSLTPVDASGREPGAMFHDMIGQSPAMQTVFHIIDNVANTQTSVMVIGESGTGKELVARAIHDASERRDGAFVALNMAAMPKELVESTLFGHERGAFTGAEKRRIGACEEANGGTLFLDEITEMPLELQAKLLRFLQERKLRRVGAAEDIFSDARIVSATNRDPLSEVSRGQFREDLYYRLNVVPIDLPPLRERSGDIELLTMHALRTVSKRYGKGFTDIEPAAMNQLLRHRWPGNVRELYHLIERCVVLNEGPTLTGVMLPSELLGQRTDAAVNGRAGDTTSPASVLPEAVHAPTDIVPMAELERRAIQQALAACGDSPSKAAHHLGISEATIYRKIKAYGLRRAKSFGASHP